MTAMDEYVDSAMEADDIFPCKGCGEILEEGKAFELAGHRWHLNCFRCNTCGTLLDSDANLLLLGDGSLICNNCTYSCSACGNKIEDLAILTGDQAFCATCFRCRNCKRKIENLRYARTSQGIFCMNCHESLMARRRKKHKAAAQAKAREKEGSPMITEKSLPALPPNAAAARPDGHTELSPRPPRPTYARDDSTRSGQRSDRSPERSASDATTNKDASGGGLTVSPPNYRKNRTSAIIGTSLDLGNSDSESFFIPVALDPSPAMPQTARSASDSHLESGKKPNDKDYYAGAGSGVDNNNKMESSASTPHIAFQEKTRSASPSDYGSSSGATPRDTPKDMPVRNTSKSARSERSMASSSTGVELDHRKLTNGRGDEFKLQDAPKSKKAAASARSNSQSSTAFENGSSKAWRDKEKSPVSPPTSTSASSSTGRSSQDARLQQDEDDGRPSLESAAAHSATGNSRPSANDQHPRGGAITRKELPASARTVNGKPISSPLSDVTSPAMAPLAPPQAPPRPNPADTVKLTDTYMQPRAPPQPPVSSNPPGKEPMTVTIPNNNGNNNEGNPNTPTGPSPKLPRWSSGGDFSLDEDMARILGTDEGSSSLLRRVSNAVRHGRNSSAESSNNYNHHMNGRPGHNRSLSETTRATASPRWPKTPIAEDSPDGHAHDISSPISLGGGSGAPDDPAFLKRQLRNSEQRVAELERQFGAEKDLKSLNKKLLEKRRTVSVLDTQTEIMIRQLEVLAGYVERAKTTKQPIDAKDLEDSAIKDFVQRLNELQKAMALSVEQLHAERDQLCEEKNQAIADRDRALLEFEQLSSKNAQLADMNNDLTHQIQERFKSHINSETNKSPAPGAGGSGGNGLGIYHPNKGPSISSMNLESASIQTSGGVTLVGTDADEPIVESGPTVVNIRKGQVRKFNWKKGSKTVAQNFSKGVNRAVGAFQNDRDQRGGAYPGLTGDNIGLPYNMTVTSVDSPATFNGATGPQANRGNDLNNMGNRGPGMVVGTPYGGASAVYNGSAGAGGAGAAGGGFGFFKKSSTMPRSGTAPALSNLAAVAAEPPSTLFGSDLVERADYERRQIPSVVTRCIEEVELRGMDIEGIYRKTGGNSQVKAIREGFEKQEDYDISDPSLDITAVTSVLKQYFRKLPDPLLTYEVYDRILESNSIVDVDERCGHLRKTLNMLPQKHRDCMEFLMFHLARVANRERENLMSPKNLAVVFAPTIMRDLSVEREMTDMHVKNIAVQFIIENSNVIFSEQ